MANVEHLEILRQGPDIWNVWRQEHPNIIPDLAGAVIGAPSHIKSPPPWNVELRGINLSKANLVGACLRAVDLDKADLSFANLSLANLWKSVLREAKVEHAQFRAADLSDANFYGSNMNGVCLKFAKLHRTTLSSAKLLSAQVCGSDLREAQLDGASMSFSDLRLCNLERANLNRADLHQADLSCANLTQAKFKGADLSHAKMTGACLHQTILHDANLRETDMRDTDMTESDLRGCSLIKTDLRNSILESCKVYGICAWDLVLDEAVQSNLLFGYDGEPTMSVGDIEVAQFIYLLVNNKKIGGVIDSITSKVVLILGSFHPERKTVLDAIRDKLRSLNYTPVMFDFDPPQNRDLTDTVKTLAHLARFLIVDLSDPRSVPHELASIVPNLVVPVIPIVTKSQDAYGMFTDLQSRYDWVLDTFIYEELSELLDALEMNLLPLAEAKLRKGAV